MTPARRGYSLLELVVSIAIASLVIGAMTSVVVLASHAMLRETPASDAARALDLLHDDLRYALHVSEQTPTSLACAIPDRDGDGIEDRVRYELVDGRLERSINGETPDVLVEPLARFAIAFEFKDEVDQRLGPIVDDPREYVVASHDAGGVESVHVVHTNQSCGQYFEPRLPADAVSWSLTRFGIKMRRRSVVGTAIADLSLADATLRPGDPFETALVLTAFAEDDFEWYELPHVNATGLPVDRGFVLALRTIDQVLSLELEQDGVSGAGMLSTNDNGATWAVHGNASLSYYAMGTIRRPSGRLESVRSVAHRAAIELALSAGPVLRASVPTVNRPERLDGAWWTGFEKDPTTTDRNGDGLADWRTGSNGALVAPERTDGVWTPLNDASLETMPARPMRGPTRVITRVHPIDAGSQARLIISAEAVGRAQTRTVTVIGTRTDDGTQRVTLYDGTRTTGTPLVEISGLHDAPLDLGILVDPDQNLASLRVRDVDHGAWPVEDAGDDGTGVRAATASGRVRWEQLDVRADVATMLTDPSGLTLANEPPAARLVADRIWANPGEPVRFDAGATTDPNGGTLSFDWAFGDGTQRSGGQTHTHTYDTDGVYQTTVRVRDATGAASASTVQVVIGGAS